MRSLQRRLALGLGAGIGLLVAVTAVVIYEYAASTVWGGVDASLEAEARRLADAVHLDIAPEARTRVMRLGAEVLRELERDDEAAARRRAELNGLARRSIRTAVAPRPWDAAARVAAHLYEVRDAQGRVIARSRALRDRPLAPEAPLAGGMLRLPDGARGRALQRVVPDVPFANATWHASWIALRDGLRLRPARATVIVAANTEAQHALLGRLRSGLWIFGVLAVALAIGLAVLTTRRTLAPLRRLRRDVASLDVASLGAGVRLERPVTELAPIADALNGALRGLEASFEREKRMTEDLAHELRTPVAELKSITDVAAEWPEDAALQARCVTRCRGIADRMMRLVAVLLRVARARTAEPARSTELDVREHLVASWRLLESTAATREQHLELAPGDAASVRSDPDVVDAILANLLQNAIEHAPAGSRIVARLEAGAETTTLTLSNPAGALTADEAEHALEPFWRADAARTRSRQGGLGLSLVAELARAAALDFDVAVEDGRFAARLAFPTVPAA